MNAGTNNGTPIFLHSLFRTGSTYVWNKFRETGDYHCYYEPFHEALLDLTDQKKSENMTEKTQSMSHPKLQRHYFEEYPLETGRGVRFFHKEFTIDQYCVEEDEKKDRLKQYVEYLIDQAPRRAVLGFCRSTMRSAWLMNNFDGFHVYILRNQRNQWESYQSFRSEPYFNTVNVMILGKNSSTRKLQPLQDLFGVPHYENRVFDMEYQFYRKYALLLSDRDRYRIFFYIWLLSLMENYATCELILDIDALTKDDSTRQRVSQILQRNGVHLSFDDCSIRSYEKFTLSDEEMSSIEEDVICMINDASIFDQVTADEVLEYLNLPAGQQGDRKVSRATENHVGLISQVLTDQIMEQGGRIEQLERICGEMEIAIEDKEARIAEADACLSICNGQLNDLSSLIERIIDHLKTEGASAILLNDVGEMCAVLRKVDKADELFSMGLAREPNNAVMLNNLGTLHFARGEYESAIGCFVKACDIAPDDRVAYRNLEMMREILSMSVSHNRDAVDGDPREAPIGEHEDFRE